MEKKKKRIHDSGKSVLHVKNSSGGFYKVKKSGKLGKDCIHFHLGKKTCKKWGGWCQNASTCPAYQKR